jgi:anti-sigma factor RsiW
MGEPVECRDNERVSLLMSLALDGPLAAADQQVLQGHLAACPACRAEWEAMQQLSALFKSEEMIGPRMGFATRVERRLADKAKKRRRGGCSDRLAVAGDCHGGGCGVDSAGHCGRELARSAARRQRGNKHCVSDRVGSKPDGQGSEPVPGRLFAGFWPANGHRSGDCPGAAAGHLDLAVCRTAGRLQSQWVCVGRIADCL